MKSNPIAQLKYFCKKESSYYLNSIDLIAASNYVNPQISFIKEYSIQRSMEGLYNKRPYASTKYLNKIENIGIETAKRVFKADYANLQPHSCTQANQAAYAALLNPGDMVLSMRFNAGGHLSHGNPLNFSGRFYQFIFYDINEKTQQIDYEELKSIALKKKPKLIIAGASSYPRIIDYSLISKIAKSTDSYFMADIAHPIGLIAAGKFPSPVPFADIVTASLEKTFAGVHSGIILAKKEFESQINRAVHPGVQSSVPIMRIIQASLSLLFAETVEFKSYITRVLNNAKILEKNFSLIPDCILFGGTDCHFIVINTVSSFGLDGKTAENILEGLGIFTNRQIVPGEKLKPYIASGLRIGTPAATARGYDEIDFQNLSEIIICALQNSKNNRILNKLKKQVNLLIHKKRKIDSFFNKIYS